MPPEQAVIMAGRDADWHTRDLYDNIAKGNFPSWNVTAELLTPEQAKNMRWNPFDVTKVRTSILYYIFFSNNHRYAGATGT